MFYYGLSSQQESSKSGSHPNCRPSPILETVSLLTFTRLWKCITSLLCWKARMDLLQSALKDLLLGNPTVMLLLIFQVRNVLNEWNSSFPTSLSPKLSSQRMQWYMLKVLNSPYQLQRIFERMTADDRSRGPCALPCAPRVLKGTRLPRPRAGS